MSQTLSLTRARALLPSIADELERHPEEGAVTLTRHGKPVMTLISSELYETIIETMEILSDRDSLASLRKGIEEARSGKLLPFAKVRKKLGI